MKQHDALRDDQIDQLAHFALAAIDLFTEAEGARPDVWIGRSVWLRVHSAPR